MLQLYDSWESESFFRSLHALRRFSQLNVFAAFFLNLETRVVRRQNEGNTVDCRTWPKSVLHLAITAGHKMSCKVLLTAVGANDSELCWTSTTLLCSRLIIGVSLKQLGARWPKALCELQCYNVANADVVCLSRCATNFGNCFLSMQWEFFHFACSQPLLCYAQHWHQFSCSARPVVLIVFLLVFCVHLCFAAPGSECCTLMTDTCFRDRIRAKHMWNRYAQYQCVAQVYETVWKGKKPIYSCLLCLHPEPW